MMLMGALTTIALVIKGRFYSAPSVFKTRIGCRFLESFLNLKNVELYIVRSRRLSRQLSSWPRVSQLWLRAIRKRVLAHKLSRLLSIGSRTAQVTMPALCLDLNPPHAPSIQTPRR